MCVRRMDSATLPPVRRLFPPWHALLSFVAPLPDCVWEMPRCVGVYLFFVFFALGMLLILLVIGAARLFYAGYVPKVVLVATSHSIGVSQIAKKILRRRSDIFLCMRIASPGSHEIDQCNSVTQGSRRQTSSDQRAGPRQYTAEPTHSCYRLEVPLHASQTAAVGHARGDAAHCQWERDGSSH